MQVETLKRQNNQFMKQPSVSSKHKYAKKYRLSIQTVLKIKSLMQIPINILKFAPLTPAKTPINSEE